MIIFLTINVVCRKDANSTTALPGMNMFPLVLLESSREEVISGTCVHLESCNAKFSAGRMSTPCFCDNLTHFNTFSNIKPKL